MNSNPDAREVLCCPTGLLPIGLSLGALLIVFMHIAFYGPAPEPEGGATAHVWQLIMAAQIPALGLFAAKWFRQARQPALQVLKLHGASIVVSVAAAGLAPVYFLHL
jgi:hypothetical protein